MGMYPSADLFYGFAWEPDEENEDLAALFSKTITDEKYGDYDLWEEDSQGAIDAWLAENGLCDFLHSVSHGNSEYGYMGYGIAVSVSVIGCRAYDVKSIVMKQPDGKAHKAINKAAEMLGMSDQVGWRMTVSWG